MARLTAADDLNAADLATQPPDVSIERIGCRTIPEIRPCYARQLDETAGIGDQL